MSTRAKAKLRCTMCRETVCCMRQTVDGERLCVLCLSSRLDAAHRTLASIEAACAQRGYDPDSGEFLGDWLQRRLAPRPGVCRVCGCTELAACEGGCSWVDPARTLCNLCAAVAL